MDLVDLFRIGYHTLTFFKKIFLLGFEKIANFKWLIPKISLNYLKFVHNTYFRIVFVYEKLQLIIKTMGCF